MTQKKFRVRAFSPPEAYVPMPQEQVDAFAKRVNERMREVSRIIRRNQKLAEIEAHFTVLNA